MAATAAHYSPQTTIELSSVLARKFFRRKQYQLDTGSLGKSSRRYVQPLTDLQRKLHASSDWALALRSSVMEKMSERRALTSAERER